MTFLNHSSVLIGDGYKSAFMTLCQALFDGTALGMGATHIARQLKIGRSTIYKILKTEASS